MVYLIRSCGGRSQEKSLSRFSSQNFCLSGNQLCSIDGCVRTVWIDTVEPQFSVVA